MAPLNLINPNTVLQLTFPKYVFVITCDTHFPNGLCGLLPNLNGQTIRMHVNVSHSRDMQQISYHSLSQVTLVIIHITAQNVSFIKGWKYLPRVMKVTLKKKVMSFPYRSNYLGNSSSQHTQTVTWVTAVHSTLKQLPE
jgi:hypothetical protein